MANLIGNQRFISTENDNYTAVCPSEMNRKGRTYQPLILDQSEASYTIIQ